MRTPKTTHRIFATSLPVILFIAVLAFAACRHGPRVGPVFSIIPPPPDGSISLAYILAHPDHLPFEQTIIVQGYLAVRGFNPMLYLTSEHAYGRDARSAILVSPNAPHTDPGFVSCLERFVSVAGVLWRSPAGEIEIMNVSKIEYWKSPGASTSDWGEVIPVVCYSQPSAT